MFSHKNPTYKIITSKLFLNETPYHILVLLNKSYLFALFYISLFLLDE